MNKEALRKLHQAILAMEFHLNKAKEWMAVAHNIKREGQGGS